MDGGRHHPHRKEKLMLGLDPKSVILTALFLLFVLPYVMKFVATRKKG